VESLLPILIQSDTDALGVIDVQPTFMPGGSLPTPHGELVITPINRIIQQPFGFRFATQDWHPPGHISFASRHPGYTPKQTLLLESGPLMLWPDHALQGAEEANLHNELNTSLLDLVMRKGVRPEADGLSAFSDQGGGRRSGLASLLRERGIQRLFLVGLALDLCVTATAEDAAREGFSTYVIEDACRSSMPELLEATRQRLDRVGVQLLMAEELS
jgi:nicotinamidase/pyrazinamidase